MLDFFIAIFLGSFAFAVYHKIGLGFLQTSVFRFNDVIFGSDFFRFIGDLAKLEASHHRTGVHPLFVLIFNPLGRFFTDVFGSPELAALFICNFFGALNIALFYLIIRKLGANRLLSIVCTLVYEFSMTALVWSSVTESFSISCFGAMLLFLIYLSNLSDRSFYPIYGIASLIAFGVLTTNIVPIILLLWARLRKNGSSKLFSDFSKITLFICAVVGVAAGLAWVQKILYPSSFYFLDPKTYAREMRLFVYYDIIEKPYILFTQVLPHFLAFNFVAPGFSVNFEHKPLIGFDYSLRGILPKIAVILWCVWVVWSIVLIVRKKIYLKTIFRALVAYELFYIVLHCFYGVIEQFLYSLHYAFGIVLMMALPHCQIKQGKSKSASLLVLALFFVVFGFELAANISFIRDTLAFLFGSDFQTWVNQALGL